MNILILSPHADDAELGCGGSIAKLIEDGHNLLWVVFSTAEDSLPNGLAADTLKIEFVGVIKGLGLGKENYKIFDFRVRQLHEIRQEILENLINMRDEFKPQLVIGPSLNDFHQDHQVVANEMIRAFKATSSILCYELPWNHVTFNTQLFIKFQSYQMKKKCAMLKNYKSQLANGKTYFSKEFIYGLAKIRGVQCGSEYAEAFEVIRWMID